jgi:8-oxo-dGTP pyrophosphatase MutT (NUDIX family)
MSQKSSRVFKQSGVIPYRVRNGKIEVLLITNRRRQHWLIPKGGIKRAMGSPDSAAKEAWEEAGVLGKVDGANKLGTYEYHKRGDTYRVEVFLLPVEKVLKDWPEASIRKRQWLGLTKAVKRVEPAELKRILKSSPTQITSINCNLWQA